MRLIRLASSIAPLVLFAACGAAPGSSSSPVPTGPPAEATPENISEGQRLFNNGVCVNCHGAGGKGGTGGPPLADRTWLHGNGSYSQIVAIIKDGFTLGDMMDSSAYHRPMPPRGQRYVNNTNMLSGTAYTDKEVGQVAAYVWSISHDMPKPPTP